MILKTVPFHLLLFMFIDVHIPITLVWSIE